MNRDLPTLPPAARLARGILIAALCVPVLGGCSSPAPISPPASNPNPRPTVAPSLNSLLVEAAVAKQPQRVTIGGAASDANGDLARVTVDWGDGGDATVLTSNFDGFSASRDYALSGTYAVTVTATDAAGLSSAPRTERVTVANLQHGLRAFYPLSGSGEERGGQNSPRLDASLRGDGCFAPTSDRFGAGGAALTFNLGAGSVACGRSQNGALVAGGLRTPPLNLPPAFSLSFWVNPDNFNQGEQWVLGQAGAAQAYLGQSSALGGAPRRLSFALPGAKLLVTDPTDLAPNTWTHFTVTVSADGDGTTATLYREGEQVATATRSATSAAVNLPWSVADQDGGGAESAEDGVFKIDLFSGGMDELRFYARVLSGDEVAALDRFERERP